MNYKVIDHLLLNVNKGPGTNSPAGSANLGPPRPGDSVMVAAGDRGLLNVLIHGIDQGNQSLRGETIGSVRDSEGREIIGERSRVRFSFQKIAGIHRR
jgi:hypothetical protein